MLLPCSSAWKNVEWCLASERRSQVVHSRFEVPTHFVHPLSSTPSPASSCHSCLAETSRHGAQNMRGSLFSRQRQLSPRKCKYVFNQETSTPTQTKDQRYDTSLSRTGSRRRAPQNPPHSNDRQLPSLAARSSHSSSKASCIDSSTWPRCLSPTPKPIMPVVSQRVNPNPNAHPPTAACASNAWNCSGTCPSQSSLSKHLGHPAVQQKGTNYKDTCAGSESIRGPCKSDCTTTPELRSKEEEPERQNAFNFFFCKSQPSNVARRGTSPLP